ncbi:type II CRISPR RNA-guided endonuclease Cas9 [Candidatus Saccharibacteria bacterium]|nr:type II CRISPR RNA-guided endonuclease Cas9 [Candidatus Saccharibacteria bacterium]
MKKILGLDLGVGSIGWSVISVDENGDPSEILGMGSRIVPLSTDDANEFSTGNAISKNQKRTQKRTARKGYDRYQLRRENLTAELRMHQMLPDEHLIKLPVLDLWTLRANAATEGHKLSLPEIGRVLYHINQKRGYKHAKADEAGDKKQTEYVENVNKRFAMIKDLGLTIGHFFASKLKESEVLSEKGKFYTYRTKEQVFPRGAYIAEFDQIIEVQRKFYPQVFTDEFINRLRNEIIFYQRNLKSCKHLVSLCEFEKHEYKNKDGKIVFDGPKVAPRTSPLFQICRIWEIVNNIRLENGYKEARTLSQDERLKVVDFLDNHEKMTAKDFTKLLELNKNDEWDLKRYFGKNGTQGNTTKIQLATALANVPNASELLQFNLTLENSNYVNEKTGEVLKVVSSDFQNEPLYMLWHTVYSLSDKEELKNALIKKYGITDESVINNLFKIDFVKPGFGNKSAKAIRRILPFLQDGLVYSDACAEAGYNHSNSLTKSENEARTLLARLPQIKKNELRQPVIEKILNQMVNVVNAIYDEYGQIDEIRVELARELKQTKDERNTTASNIAKRERENKNIEAKIQEFGIRSSRNRIQKYRLWEESDQKCFYCGQPVQAKEFLSGLDVEVEHIIPKSLLFDDSFANKVCACRKCNAAKGNKTAYDFMKGQKEEVFDAYVKRVNDFYKDGKISKTKKERLLTTQSEIPSDFIERQLRQTQYIAKKAIEMLKDICYNVYATSGSVTDFIRHTWGYDEILHQLNFDRYKKGGLTELREYDHKGETHTEERIQNWSKRLDHRHHAIDALVIAMTRQSIIQRLNHLNTERDAMFQEVEKQSKEWKNDYSMLQEWLRERKHFPTEDVAKKVSDILVSFKAGKRVATIGKRVKYEHGKKIVLQTGITIPRGPLCEESVYGKIKVLDRNKPLKYLLENPQYIVNADIKFAITNRLAQYENDVKKAVQSLKKSPVVLANGKKLENADCYKEEFVIKYSLNGFKAKDIDSVVDNRIKDVLYKRLEEYNGNEKEAFKDIENNPIYADATHKIKIRNVRCFTGLSAVVPVKKDENGNAIGFVKPGNNHHVAIYKDENGNLQESVVTFWHAVERKKYGLPIVITNPIDAWKLAREQNCPKEFLDCLPNENWIYEQSLQENEMFVMGLDDNMYDKAVAEKNYALLNQHLYRVQKISSSDYYFRYHLETKLDDSASAIEIGKYKRIRSFKAFALAKPHKVKISLLGKLITRV